MIEETTLFGIDAEFLGEITVGMFSVLGGIFLMLLGMALKLTEKKGDDDYDRD